jgi:hypothetical protein
MATALPEYVTKVAADEGNQTKNGMEDGVNDPLCQKKSGGYRDNK